MARALAIQTIGSMIVIATFIAAESAALLLAANPGSALAWYLNLEVFAVFERARAEPSPLRFLFGAASLPIACVLLVIVGVIGALRLRLGVAIAANLGFCFAVALAYAAIGDPAGQGDAALGLASLLAVTLRPDASAVTGILLGASLIAAVASHAGYVSAMLVRNPPRQP